ncbi:MAG TPA: dimethylamine corrinoid protein 3 [Desulfobacteraceae bacterium]|nr:corrinoid protein [Deltaproteobacteria bacterium]MBW2082273.1 corrinoid protein [Deltaproteobacteria bacterium]HDZ23009.1 dimethylamine corrinoid protein 3 [Desulfobacteraceae bacterium]
MIGKETLEEAKQAIINYDKEKAVQLTEKVISDGVDPLEIMNNGFIPGINEVGDLFGRGVLFLPELVQCADVMKTVTDIINNALPSQENAEEKGSMVIATVKGDVHDIGKCIVVALLQANGYTVYDLGRDVDTDRIIEEAVKVEADIIGTSALLTTTMTRQKELEEALKSIGLRDKFKTIVGGAPVTGRWAAKIGADAYAEDAQDAVLKVKELLAS